MNIPETLRYTKDHEWVSLEGNIATIGITDFAQGEWGDIVYVELPEVDDEIEVEDRVTEVMRHVALASSRLLKIREEQLKEKQEKRKKSESQPEEQIENPGINPDDLTQDA